MTTHALNLAVIRASGADAKDFLHNQLTQSVQDLQPDRARLFSYCSPRGRVLANGLIWLDNRAETQLHLMVHQSVAKALLQKLQMYVLRAKVKFERLEAAQIMGTTQPSFLTTLPASQQGWELPIYHGDHEHVLAIQAPGTTGQAHRFWQINLADEQSIDDQMIPAQQWRWQDLCLGWPWVVEATSEAFIPQNLNLDLLAAVNFEKGCFPGQEIVARSHYRTTIRRRALLFSAPLLAGQENSASSLPGTDIILTDPEGKSRPAGRIANAVAMQDKLWLLAETNLDFVLEKAALSVQENGAEPLHMHELPFQAQLPWEDPRKKS